MKQARPRTISKLSALLGGFLAALAADGARAAEIVDRDWLKVETGGLAASTGMVLDESFFIRVPSASLAPPPVAGTDSRLALILSCGRGARLVGGVQGRVIFLGGASPGAVVVPPGSALNPHLFGGAVPGGVSAGCSVN